MQRAAASIARTFVSLAEVAVWQTRRTQNPVHASGCGFKSHLRHCTQKRIAFISPSEIRRQHAGIHLEEFRKSAN
jgi:hypothetical protein